MAAGVPRRRKSAVLFALGVAMVRASLDVPDRSPHCTDWAAAGECGSNPEYMLDECAQSCGAEIRALRAAQAERSASKEQVGANASAAQAPVPSSGSQGMCECREQLQEAWRQCQEQLQRKEKQIMKKMNSFLQDAVDKTAALSAEASSAAEAIAADAEEKCEERLQESEEQLREQFASSLQECKSKVEHESQRAQAAALRSSNVVNQLRECDRERQEAAKAIKGVKEEYQEHLAEELAIERRGYERKVKRLEKQEWQHREVADMTSRRAWKAEEKLKKKESGLECKAAARRNAALAREAQEVEAARLKLETLHQKHRKESDETVKRLQAAVAASAATNRAMQQDLAAARAHVKQLNATLKALSGDNSSVAQVDAESESARAKCKRAAGLDGAAACDALPDSEDDWLPWPREFPRSGPLAVALLFGLAYSMLGFIRLVVDVCRVFWGLCMACIQLPDEVRTTGDVGDKSKPD